MYNLHFMDLFIHHVVMMVVSTFVVMSVISIIVVMDVAVMVFLFVDNWGHNNWLCIVATVEARVI